MGCCGHPAGQQRSFRPGDAGNHRCRPDILAGLPKLRAELVTLSGEVGDGGGTGYLLDVAEPRQIHALPIQVNAGVDAFVLPPFSRTSVVMLTTKQSWSASLTGPRLT